MIVYMNKETTALELAKEILLDQGVQGADYWFENSLIEHDLLTRAEKREIENALDRHIYKISKFLGIRYIIKEK